jgi:hypothetical protein
MPVDGYNTNAEAVGRRMVEAIRTFDFEVAHEGRVLGKIIADEIADGIMQRSSETQSSPSEGHWPPNEARYARAKMKYYGTDKTNYRTGQMVSKESLLGEVDVVARLVRIMYGADRPPVKTSINDWVPLIDQHATDTDKSFYAHEQGRGFFELDDEICNTVYTAVNAALAEHLHTHG